MGSSCQGNLKKNPFLGGGEGEGVGWGLLCNGLAQYSWGGGGGEEWVILISLIS